MKTLSTTEVKEIRDRHEQHELVNVLSDAQFEQKHIPGSIHVPLGQDLPERLQAAVQDKSRPIIVYCADKACDASSKAARMLEKAGFENVYDFEGGLKAWEEAGNPVEGAAVSSS